MLRGFTSDPERAAISVTTRLADLGSCTDCQSVLNAAARLVFLARRSERITPLLRELHWLRVPEGLTFRLCVLAYRYLHGTAPAYLAESLHRTSDVDTRRRPRFADSTMLDCWWYRPPDVQHSVTVPSHGFGTCVEQPAVVCQECTVADDVPSRVEDHTFPVVIVLHSITVVCPRLLTVGYSVVFVFLFNFVRCPCNVFDVIVSS